MARIIITGLLLLLTLGSVAAAPSGLASTPLSPDGAALERGIELYQAGEADAALSLLRGFVVNHFDSPLLPRAYLYLARIFRDRSQIDEALLYLERIPPDQRSPETELVKGAALVATEDPGRGVVLLLALEEGALSVADRRLRLISLAEGRARLGEPLTALVFLQRALTLDGAAPNAELLEQAHRLLVEVLSDSELAEAAFMFQDSALGADAALQQALRAYARGERNSAWQMVQTLVESPLSFPYRRDAVLLLDQLAGRTWLQRSVGVVLPLSGRYATFGQLVRRGMELAQEYAGDAAVPVRLLFRDSGGDPQQSALAVSALANEDRVMAVAGPLTGAAAEAAAIQAQQEQLPLVTLSQRPGLPQIGPFIFRNALTSAMQIDALLSHAMLEEGWLRFGILAPENRLGREMAQLFAEGVRLRGGEIVAELTYAEGATDFRRQILLLQGKDPALQVRDGEEEPEPDGEDLEALFHPEGWTPPPVAFDALFIPDYADRVGLIAPQLAYYGIEELPLLGINGWNSPELLRLAGRYVEGAVFADGFFRNSRLPAVEDFVRRYVERYGDEPSILEAQGYDVARLLLEQVADPQVQTREDLRRALSLVDNFSGVTGEMAFDAAGEAQKSLFLLQVRRGAIVPLSAP